MKQIKYKINSCFRAIVVSSVLFLSLAAVAQEDSVATEEAVVEDEAPVQKKVKPVKNTFNSIWLIDNQTVMVPIKGTFEIDIMHRFGIVKNGYKDFWGFFAPSNIRLGFSYVPIENLLVGTSITKTNMTWEAYAKYSIIKQTPDKYPVSVTYFGDVAFDSRKKENFVHFSDRFMFFNQLLIARKLNDKISVQVAPSHTHVNIVDGYFYEPGKYRATMNHEHFAVALSGRYKIKETMAILLNYDQPITKHRSNNPDPNISFGIELSTSAHSFQFFLGNYQAIIPQRNNYFNHNDYTEGEFAIGFNITRLWNY